MFIKDIECNQSRYLFWLTFLLVPSVGHAEIYKWVDTNGVTHFSERRERGVEAKAVELKNQPPSTSKPAPSMSIDENNLSQTLVEGMRYAKSGRQQDAIHAFDKVIASYEDAYRGDAAKLFCSRSQPETLMYLLEAANTKTSAKVVSMNWAYAYYAKAYSLLELGRMLAAKESLDRAIKLSPHNSQFFSELGHVYQLEKNWPKAIEAFKLAEDAAQYSPINSKNPDLARAWRGIGYALVEQNQLDEAERMYQKCLELDKNDARASTELRHIRGLKGNLENGNLGSTKTSSANGNGNDPIKTHEAVYATFIASTTCRNPSDPPLDATNFVKSGMAAAEELGRRSPGVKPPEVIKQLNERLDKVRTTVKFVIDRDGCDSPEIRKSITNYKAFSEQGRKQPSS